MPRGQPTEISGAQDVPLVTVQRVSNGEWSCLTRRPRRDRGIDISPAARTSFSLGRYTFVYSVFG
jgi:hypothetical protein